MDGGRKYIEDIMNCPAFDRETFQSMARQYFTDDKPEIIGMFLKQQYLCEDISEIFRTHSLDEVVDFMNRLITSKDRYQRMSLREIEKLCVISVEELDEFTRLASETDKIPVDKLSKTATPLTGRSFFEMLRVGFDAAKIWDYPPDTSTAFLYSEARFLSNSDPIKLLKDPDSIEAFASSYQVLYHNEEIWFGGPGIVIHDETARSGGAYTCTYKYTEWTGRVYSERLPDIIKLYKAIKMYIALRNAGYPVYYSRADEDKKDYLKFLDKVRLNNDRLTK